tara:strand:+ start:2159 stop:2503 length:345 start_codon:yes stop_codon:yes gene_type:complete
MSGQIPSIDSSENLDKHWFDFLKAGHAVLDMGTEKVNKDTYEAIHLFTVNGKDFELIMTRTDLTPTKRSTWFQLYALGQPSGGKVMWGSDFYTLGRKDIHDMADDGVRHLKKGA